MIVLALDLGTRTGWAHNAAGQIQSGYFDCKQTRQEGAGMRFVRFKRELSDIYPLATELVVYEDVKQHAGTYAAHIYGGLLAVLMAWCESRDIPYTGVGVGQIKRHATGKGNASKDLMVQAAAGILGLDVLYDDIDHNQADAVCLLDYWLKQDNTPDAA